MKKQSKRELKSKNILLIFLIAVFASVCLGIYNYNTVVQTAFAADQPNRDEYIQNCVNLSGIHTVSSVSAACGLCYDSDSNEKVPRGAMWFNDGTQGADSNVVKVADGNAQTASISLWGRMWSCGGNSIKANQQSNARYLWFGEQGQYMTDEKGNLLNKADFITPNNAKGSLFRGTWAKDGGGQWTLPATPIAVTLDIPKFKEYAKAHGGFSTSSDGSGLETYRASVSVNRCANTTLGMYKNTTGDKEQSTCYGDDSEIVLMIPPSNEEEPDPTPSTLKGVFTSQSFGKVEIDDDISGKETYSPKSGIDGMLANQNAAIKDIDSDTGKAGLAITSVDINQDSIDLEFWHKLYYNVDPSDKFTEKDEAPSVSTDWTIKTEIKVSGKRTKENKHPADGSWSTISTKTGKYEVEDSKNSATSSKDLPSEAYLNEHVDLEKGRTTLVCSTIEYKPKTVYFSVKKDHDGKGGHEVNHSYYEYEKKDGTDSGSSQACIAIYRPIEPEGTPWSGSKSGGDVESDPMYAGEKTKIGWDVWAEGSITDRISSFQAANYIMPTDADNNNSLLQGKYGVSNLPNNGSKICEFYAPLQISGLCNGNVPYPAGSEKTETDVDSDGNTYTFWHELDAEAATVAPNEVGRKHANTAGYLFERWVCEPNDDGGCTWRHYLDKNGKPSKDYWHIYNTAARTVLKKPSVAFWNGGVFTTGDIDTLIATRYDNIGNGGKDAIFVPADGNNDKTSFGSWSEYLATVSGTATGLTSGTALSGGLSVADFKITENSPLTISNNTSTIGGSGIGNDTVLRQRLQNYFFNLATENQNLPGVHFTSDINDIQAGGTTIVVKANGVLDITSNIGLDYSTVSSIYKMPQVLIYAKDGINIGEDVTRIDAWLVTTGTLNTCSNAFVARKTEANVNGFNSSDKRCYKSLTINGPVIANRVKLNRTYGADGISNNDKDLVDPGGSDTRAATAEVFNLSMDSYLWAYAQSGRYRSSYSEAYSRELPPRY